MLEDARGVSRGSVVQADLCIVGAGAAGITIAKTLAGTGLSVVLTESGGLESEAETQDLYKGPMVGTEMQSASGPLTLDQIRLRFFGGTTNHWAGWCRPLEPIDFGPTPARPDIAWPFGRDALDPWYDQAGALCQLGPFDHTYQGWTSAGLSQPLLETDLVTTRIIQVSFPTKFGELYRSELRQASNVRVLTHANLVRFDTDPEGGSVTAAAIKTLGGNEFTVQARAFVLATGGIEVPRLLLASNQARPKGLGNENDHVGRYFMEHIDVGGGFAVLPQSQFDMSLYNGKDVPVSGPGRESGRTIQLKGAHILTDKAIQEHELFGIEATLESSPFPQGPVQDAGIKDEDAATVYEQLSGRTPGVISYVRLLAEQSPNPRSRVTLTNEADPLGVPRAQLDWQITKADRDSMRKGLTIMADELGRLSAGRLQVGVGGIEFNTGPAKTLFDLYKVTPADFTSNDFPVSVGFHHMGTARMTSDPEQGVVDPNCKVHSVSNLYIGGSAVFPTTGTSTPTFTIVALALRLADHLQKQVLV